MKFETEGELPDFRALLAAFPELSARVLGYIGKRAAMQLYEEHLRGQDIEFHPASHSSTGVPEGKSFRRMVTYSVGRGLKWVAVSSFPLNLYENRRQLRRGDAARRGILRRNFKSSLSTRTASYIAEAENLIVDDWFNSEKRRKGTVVAGLRQI